MMLFVNHSSYSRVAFPLALLASAALLALGGCPGQGENLSESALSSAARPITAGDSVVTLRPNASEVFEVDVPEGKSFEVLVESLNDTALAVEQIEIPGGEVFRPSASAKGAQGNDLVAVEPLNGAKSLRLSGRANAGGTWRLHLKSASRLSDAALRDAARTRSVLENVLLLIYLMNGAPDNDDALTQVVHWSFPELDSLRAPVEVRLSVQVLEGEAFVPVGQSEGGSSEDPNSGSGGSGGESDPNSGGGGDPNSGGGGGGGSPTDPNTGGGGGGSDPNAPPSKPNPTTVELAKIARTGDAVPNQPNATFTVFSNPVIDAEGRVAFWAGYKGGAGAGGLYVYQNGSITEVLRGDKSVKGVVPGGSANSFWGPINIAGDGGKAPTMAWGAGGRLLFTTYTNDSPLPNGLYRWRASDGNMVRVVDDTTFKSVFPNLGDTFLPEFYHPGFTDDGLVTFASRYSYFDKSGKFYLFQRGVFVSNGNTISPIVAESLMQGVVVPNGGFQFAAFKAAELLPVPAGNGTVLFQTSYETSPNGNQGLYTWTNGTIRALIDNRTVGTWPGLPAGIQVGESGVPFDAMASSYGGRHALETKITEGGQTREAVLYWDGSKWTELRSSDGQPATALLSGINSAGKLLYLAGGQPHLGDAAAQTNLSSSLPNDLRSLDALEWESFGGAINNQGRALLRFKRSAPNGAGIAMWTGTTALIVAETGNAVLGDVYETLYAQARPEMAKINEVGVLKDRPEVDRPGRSGMFNDLDQAVFRVGNAGPDGKAGTADDVQGVYLASGK